MVRFRVDLPRKKGISNRMAGRLMLLKKVNESPCVSGNRKKRLADIRKTAGKEGQSMEKLQIVYLPPGDLKPYEKNARF